MPGLVKVNLTANLYAIWARDHFTPNEPANPSISGTDATPANDGVKNLLKYAFPTEIPKLTRAAARQRRVRVGFSSV